jgi:hypothetical protein
MSMKKLEALGNEIDSMGSAGISINVPRDSRLFEEIAHMERSAKAMHQTY